MDLNTLANLAEVIGVFIVIGGFGFAFIQLAHLRRQRHDLAAIQLSQSFENPEFTRAMRLVLSLPDGVTTSQLKEMDPHFEDAAMLVSLTLESVGIMVHRRTTSLEMVWELMGGVTLRSWEKLHVWAGEHRTASGRGKFDEWFEWLCNQMRRHMVDTEPAYLRHKDWKPTSPGRWF
jgi:hypothetical protein